MGAKNDINRGSHKLIDSDLILPADAPEAQQQALHRTYGREDGGFMPRHLPHRAVKGARLAKTGKELPTLWWSLSGGWRDAAGSSSDKERLAEASETSSRSMRGVRGRMTAQTEGPCTKQ